MADMSAVSDGLVNLLTILSDKDAPKLLAEFKRSKDEHDKSRASAETAIRELRNTQNNIKDAQSALDIRTQALDKRDRELSSAKAAHDDAAAALSRNMARHKIDSDSLSSALSSLQARENSLGDRELKVRMDREAADALKAEYETKLASLRNLVV